MKKKELGRHLILFALAFCLPVGNRAMAQFVALPENGSTIGVLEDDETYLEFGFLGWGPNWQWLGFRGEIAQRQTESRLTSRATVGASGAEVSFDVVAKQDGPRRMTMDVKLQTDRDTDLTYMIASVEIPQKVFADGKLLVAGASGDVKTMELPLGLGEVGEDVRRLTLVDSSGRRTAISLSPGCDVASDNEIRVILANRRIQSDQPRQVTISVDLPQDLTYYPGSDSVPAESDFDQWYTFRPGTDHDKPSEIGLSDWLDAPAGKYGRIARREDELLYNGKPIKLWGLNVCFSSCAPDKELAQRRAAFYAKYGVNSVRLHKYADGSGWAGILSEESFVEFDPAGLDRMDYFIAQLKERGIYVKLSAHFGSQKLGPADKRYVPYLDELGSFSGRTSRITTPHSAVHYAPELQNVQILQMVNLLKHKNPYTGLTYAEDPGVAFIEIINEQSILFYTSMAPLKASPTIRRYVGKRFCDWLSKKYDSHAELEEAWGGKQSFDSFQNDGFPPVGEHLDKDNILPLGNPWYWDPVQLEGSQASRKTRLTDSMLFLYELQNEFFARYVKAVREAGYQGEILSSNWQAGRAMSHYYNLHSDAQVGLIDRHNYFGGGDGGKINNVTMLRIPGSGMLSAGMQQVADRPFMLSEWIHVYPNEWGVEGPAIIGAYGLGLQGWDVSYLFQNRDNGGFLDHIGGGSWEVTAPQVLGAFPAVARQVLRGDVAQSELVATRNVHVPSLGEGKLGFDDKVTQQYDVKTFDSDKVPAQTLAVARSVVTFTDEYQPTAAFDISRFRQNGRYISSTGQLRWTEGSSKLDGHFTIDTEATKAVVGFAEGRRCELGDVSITPRCRFGAVYVTARGKDETIASSKNLLVVAMARARNTGMKVFNDSRILKRGESPVLMEPVKATITIRKAGDPTVYLLDHDGCRTSATLPVSNGTFEIDGSRDETCYYLVSY